MTLVYWGTAVLFAAAFWTVRFPPLVDYPNHLAIAAVLRRIWSGDAAARALYEVDLLTPNGAFHVVVAALSFVVPIEAAGKIVLSAIPLLSAFSALRLMRALDRPGYLAFVPLQVVFGHTFCFGFLNFTLAVPFAIWAFACWLEHRRAPTTRSLYRVLALSLVLPWLHMLAPAIAGLSAAIVVTCELEGGVRRVPQHLARLVRETWPFAPGAIVALLLAWHGSASTHGNWVSTAPDGTDVPAWEKLAELPRTVVGNFSDGSDRWTFVLTLVLALVLLVRRGADADARVPRRLAIAWLAIFMVLPRVLFSTWFFSDRLAGLVVLFFAAALPASSSRAVRWTFALLAVFAAANTVVHFRMLPEQASAARILDAIPRQRRVLGLYFTREAPPAFSRAIWTHFEGFHTVLGEGDTGASFLDIESSPVHYRPWHVPRRPPPNLEIAPQYYQPMAPYARTFDVLLVRAPSDPRPQLLGPRAMEAKVLAHDGQFWVIDTAALGASP